MEGEERETETGEMEGRRRRRREMRRLVCPATTARRYIQEVTKRALGGVAAFHLATAASSPDPLRYRPRAARASADSPSSRPPSFPARGAMQLSAAASGEHFPSGYPPRSSLRLARTSATAASSPIPLRPSLRRRLRIVGPFAAVSSFRSRDAAGRDRVADVLGGSALHRSLQAGSQDGRLLPRGPPAGASRERQVARRRQVHRPLRAVQPHP